MKKKFALENLDCANCAARLEEALNKIEGVEKASVNFILQRMTIEASDEKFEEVMTEVDAVTKKTLPDVCIEK